MAIGKQIDRYLARLIFVPLLGTFVLAAMLLLLDRSACSPTCSPNIWASPSRWG